MCDECSGFGHALLRGLVTVHKGGEVASVDVPAAMAVLSDRIRSRSQCLVSTSCYCLVLTSSVLQGKDLTTV